jgi:hypothetical protein
VNKPIASWRAHWKNGSLLGKKIEVDELKIWYQKMKDYPIIFNNKNFSNIKNIINNLEIISLILDNDREKVKFQIKKMPYSLKKIKFLIASILPKNFVKRFIQF